MDYTYDSCMNSFTYGQASRMVSQFHLAMRRDGVPLTGASHPTFLRTNRLPLQSTIAACTPRDRSRPPLKDLAIVSARQHHRARLHLLRLLRTAAPVAHHTCSFIVDRLLCVTVALGTRALRRRSSATSPSLSVASPLCSRRSPRHALKLPCTYELCKNQERGEGYYTDSRKMN